MNQEKILLAGKIASQVKEYAKSFIKKDMPLLEIAEKIEDKIFELKAKPAFPTNLSIDNIAAHYTPSHNDENLAKGLLKIDLGVSVDGWIADTAFSVDLENSELNRKLIKTAEEALKNASEKININIKTSEIGKIVEKTIRKENFSPIINLSGHQIEKYELHAGITIPNFDDSKNIILKKGLYAIEPFVSNGKGKIHDAKPSGIYMVIDSKNPRSPLARKILDFILKEYQTLPFCSRWLVKKFGVTALFALKQLEENKNLHQFAQLVEEPNSKVAQAENTILLTEKEKFITSE